MSCLHRCLKAMALVDSAELFEALSHPVRIEILKILEKQPSSFSSLKKKLGIDSSGNLDHHLKKLSGLVSVRQDGLYGLTDAGKEARLSIDDVEMWTEMEKRKIKMRTQMPREAFFLGLLEFCATASLFWFFLAIMQAASWGHAALSYIGYKSFVTHFLHNCKCSCLFGFYFFAAFITESSVAWVFLATIRTNHGLFLKRLLNVLARCLKCSLYFLGGYRESFLKLLAHLGECLF